LDFDNRRVSTSTNIHNLSYLSLCWILFAQLAE
jgi:hypothetical protein